MKIVTLAITISIPLFAFSEEAKVTPEELEIIVKSDLNPVQVDLFNAIKEISEKHGIKQSEVIMEGVKMALDSPPLLFSRGKGGVSPLGNGHYVANSSEENVIFTEKEQWKGEEGDIQQLVCVIDQNVIPISEINDNQTALFVWFKKEQIIYFDWSNFSGGYVNRSQNNNANKTVKSIP